MGVLISSDRLLVKHQKEAEHNPGHIVTAAWSPYVGAHKVCWNNAGGLRNAGWLASGTASGLGRVDWIEGKFVGDAPIPDI
jgi:transcription factor C subunit 6